MSTCPQHGVELQFRPGGISKTTGRPYNPAYRCPAAGCKTVQWLAPAQEGPQQPPQGHTAYPPGPAPSPAPGRPQGAPRGQGTDPEVWEAKDRLISASTALKAAAELFHGQPDRSTEALAYAHAFWHFLQEAKAGRKYVPDSILSLLPPPMLEALGQTGDPNDDLGF